MVKVVTDREGYALNFSRSPIPFFRNKSGRDSRLLFSNLEYEEDPLPPGPLYRHIGLYVYRRSLLLSMSQMEPTPLEAAEGLEQLRLLEIGRRIKVVPTDYHPVGGDTREDLEEARKILTGEDFP